MEKSPGGDLDEMFMLNLLGYIYQAAPNIFIVP
jgi:hypothetical protein